MPLAREVPGPEALPRQRQEEAFVTTPAKEKNMKTTSRVLILSLLLAFAVVGNPATVTATSPPPNPAATGTDSHVDISGMAESDNDILGIQFLVPEAYEKAMESGARIVNLVPMNTFFVLWIPPAYELMASRRVMVIAHGHGGNAYKELDNELKFARKYGYAIAAIQWWTGVEKVMYSGTQFYQFMNAALEYMVSKYHAQPRKCALRGWSFGSEVSFEVTYLDRVSGKNRLALTISHDGFLRPDPDSMGIGRDFTLNLYNGVYGNSAFAGKHFYLYSGSEPQIGYMQNTVNVLASFGGVVEKAVSDPGAGHAGFYQHPWYHEEALNIFFRLAP